MSHYRDFLYIVTESRLDRFMKIAQSFRNAVAFAGAAFFLAAAETMYADSATWSANPVSTDWSVKENWMPATVPNCASCVATFGTSALPQVELFGINNTFRTETVAQVTFTAGASAYTITAHASGALDFDGAGVVNESGIQQNFKTETEDGNPGVGQFFFSKGASAGTNLNTFNNGGNTGGGAFGRGGACQFNDNSTAGTAIFVNEGGSRLDAGGGEVNFYFNSTAGNATIINGGATAEGSTGGQVYFESEATGGQSVIVNNGAENDGSGGRVIFVTGATAGSAQITNNGGTVSGAGGGTVSFSFGSDAGTATITNNGGAVAGAGGGTASFSDYSDAGTATITNNGGTGAGAGRSVLSFVGTSSANLSVLVANRGTNGGDGGQIVIGEAARTPGAQFKIYGNGSLDVSGRIFRGVKAGSLEGDGLVFLGGNNFAIGFNDLDTTFAGTIMDGGIVQGAGGIVTKLGHGSLELSGANTYTGGTTLTTGDLIISNTTGSGTGPGPVQVNAGTLSGGGTIAGSVTIGTGAGSVAVLGVGTKTIAKTLTILSPLSFDSDAIYRCGLNTDTATADQVVVNGVTINEGARFSLRSVGGGNLLDGTVFAVISNTSATPISGDFNNLADGGTITIGNNTFQADYQGGDGNDLTLTVVP